MTTTARKPARRRQSTSSTRSRPAINHLRHYPNSGSLRFAFELEIPGLRSWSLQGFPYLIFYVPQDDRIDIWRVLHARRDIPTHLTAEE